MPDHSHTGHSHADKAMGIGDPQVYKGQAKAPPKFKAGDRVRVKDLPDLFYTRCQTFTRGAEGTILQVNHESPPAEDEAWGNVGAVSWFYMVCFRQRDLWPEYPESFSNDTLQTEVCELWLEPA